MRVFHDLAIRSVKQMGQKFFISFNSADSTKAHWIGWTLKEAGHQVAVHDWEIPAGGNAPLWMNSKLAWADRLIAVVSPDYAPARYSPIEWASQIWDDPDGRKGSVVPVVVRPTSEMPPLLRGLSRIDLTRCSEDEARRRLISGVDMPTVPALKPAFERIESEAPDNTEVGLEEKPTFVPYVKDIVIFERLMLAALFIGVVNTALRYKELSAGPGGAPLVLSVFFGGVVVMLTLILLISRNGSNVAKWIFMILASLMIVNYIPVLADFLDRGVVGILSICQTAMQAVAIYLLFTRESQVWFASNARLRKIKRERKRI